MGIRIQYGSLLGSEKRSEVGIRVCRTCAKESAGNWLSLHLWDMARKEKVTYTRKKKKKHVRGGSVASDLPFFLCDHICASLTLMFLFVYRQDPSKQYPHFWHWAHGHPKWSQVTRVVPGDGSQRWLEALQGGGVKFLWTAFLDVPWADMYLFFCWYMLSSFCLCSTGERVPEERISETRILA